MFVSSFRLTGLSLHQAYYQSVFLLGSSLKEIASPRLPSMSIKS
jgi:hypothetical protein